MVGGEKREKEEKVICEEVEEAREIVKEGEGEKGELERRLANIEWGEGRRKRGREDYDGDIIDFTALQRQWVMTCDVKGRSVLKNVT